MSVAAMSWVLTEASVTNPTEAMVLAVMADRADQQGRGCYYSHYTLASYARVSISTVQRTLRVLETRGLIVRGDQSKVAHIQERHRPVVWDLTLPERSVILTPREENDRSDRPERSVRTGENDRSPVTDETRTNPTTNPRAREDSSGALLGCASHATRRSSCPDCMRVLPPSKAEVRPADPAKIEAAKQTFRAARAS